MTRGNQSEVHRTSNLRHLSAWKRFVGPIIVLLITLAIQFAASRHRDFIERRYARQLYPYLAHRVGLVSDQLPFSLAEVLLVFGLLYGLYAVGSSIHKIRHCQGKWLTIVSSGTLTLISLALYLNFLSLLLCDLNQYRPPIDRLMCLNTSDIRAEQLEDLCTDLAIKANNLREKLPENQAKLALLPDGKVKTIRRAQAGYFEASKLYPILFAGRYSRAKPALLSFLLHRLNISGMHLPLTGEVIINTRLPELEIPSVACHELAHQHGFLSEDEAEFVGYLACSQDPHLVVQYSAVLRALDYALGELHEVEPAAYARLWKAQGAGVRRDRIAISNFYDQAISPIATSVIDSALKTQGHAEGIHSYSLAVRLMIAQRRSEHREAELLQGAR